MTRDDCAVNTAQPIVEAVALEDPEHVEVAGPGVMTNEQVLHIIKDLDYGRAGAGSGLVCGRGRRIDLVAVGKAEVIKVTVHLEKPFFERGKKIVIFSDF